jgi:predicted RNA-binding protein
MDKEKNWEQEESETDYTGYSEKQTDLDVEMKAGEWQNLSRFKTYRQRSRQGKIIATHQAVSNRLNQLEKLYYKLVRDNPAKGEKLLAEIKKLRLTQDILLQCIAWEPKGELTKDRVPQDVWDLIK